MASRVIAIIAASTIVATRADAQAFPLRTEIVQGRVTADGVQPIAAADVAVTMAPDRVILRTRTDSLGGYRVVIPQGTGDYLLGITKIGFAAFRKRIVRAGVDSIYLVDVKLSPVAAQLRPVQVQAVRVQPARGPDNNPEVGASERIADGVTGTLSPEQAGDLTAIASVMPGIMAVAGGVSVFGLGTAANNVTLNGMSFAGADVPRDAATRTRVSTSTYDPSRGWFSGAQTAVQLQGGGLFSTTRGHLTVDAPQLQYTDHISSQLGQRITNFNGSVGSSGELTGNDKFFYSYGVQAGRSMSPAVSALSSDADLLQHVGVSSDSIVRWRQALSTAGVPLSGAASNRVNDKISVIARFDHAPFDWKDGKPSTTTEALTFYGNFARSQGLGLGPTSTPGYGGDTRQATGAIQGLFSTYVRNYYLVEGRSAVSYAASRTSRDLALPQGQVLIASDFPEGTSGLSTLHFGGNGAFDSDLRRWTWESALSAQTYTYSADPHRVKADVDVRLDGVTQDGVINGLGTYTFNSLADLEASRPASFTRALGDPTRRGGEWNAFGSVGDLWRVSPGLQLMYGARIEGNRFEDTPVYNPAVETAFGLKTDHSPDTWDVSPRFGFTWLPELGRYSLVGSPVGQFSTPPAIFVRGGVGLFRNMLSPTLLSNASIASGLPGGLQTITCLGSAAPPATWNTFMASEANIPTTCLSGAGGQSFSDTARSVQLFDRDYTPPKSWRANLAASTSYRRLLLAIDGSYSLNLNQASALDVNFRDSTHFVSSGEGRPIFVPPSAVDPATGRVAAVLARRNASFGSVTDNLSDLRSYGRQVTVTVSPDFSRTSPGTMPWFGSLYLSAAYTLSEVRAERRGFDEATFDSPAQTEWSRPDFDVRHSLQLALGVSRGGIGGSLYMRLNSGLPFTPMVSTDVNGDGLANDRAFIFDPATVKDAQLASALAQLEHQAPTNVRRCLQRQTGRAAALNSCEGPWTSAMNAQISFSGASLHVPRNVSMVSLNLTNPLAGLDQALHGKNLRGWGTQPFADPILYTVRGFDPVTNAFLYDVNPRFGTTDPAENAVRAPFRLTLDVSVTLGRPVLEQQLERSLNPGRRGRPGPTASADELLRRYVRNVPDPYDPILSQADSLLLTPSQLQQLRAAQRSYQTKRDANWRPLAEYLATLPEAYDVRDAFKRQEAATDAAWAIAWRDVHETLPVILSRVQLTLLPGIALTLWRAPEPPRMRLVISG